MKKVLLLIAVLCFAVNAQNSRKLDKYVTDEAGVLNSNELSSLESKLSEFDKQTSTQIVVLIIKTLDGDAIENVSYETAEYNKIGRKGKDNGILLLVAIDDRKMRIEVGYGLEGAVTDIQCSQIIRKEITPEFKSGNYFEGIDKGVNALMDASRGEYTVDPTEESAETGEWIPFAVFFGAFALIFILVIIFGKNSKGGNSGSSYSGSGWNSSSSSSSWSGSSSSSSSSSFSGGGGSFGGGGSSGSW